MRNVTGLLGFYVTLEHDVLMGISVRPSVCLVVVFCQNGCGKSCRNH